jgi:hypothetical protein
MVSEWSDEKLPNADYAREVALEKQKGKTESKSRKRTGDVHGCDEVRLLKNDSSRSLCEGC